MVQFGWEKALGGYDDELAWWEGQVVQGRPARWSGRDHPGDVTSGDIGAAYSAAADGWRAGPERMYARMAEAMADHAPVERGGRPGPRRRRRHRGRG